MSLDYYNFMKGELIEVKNDIGRINFICEEYITVTTVSYTHLTLPTNREV